MGALKPAHATHRNPSPFVAGVTPTSAVARALAIVGRTGDSPDMASRSKAKVRLAVLLAFCMGVPASAQLPDVRQYAHTAWTVQDGAPGAIRGFAQGADGVLWIASERGLFQFDGVHFTRFEPLPGQSMLPQAPHVLLALPDTALWIGHLSGGVSVLHRGKIVSYSAQQGLPGGTVTALARDSAGMMWASTTRGFARLEGNRWVEMGASVGYPAGYTEPVLIDRRGAVWAVSAQGIYTLARGAARFEKRVVTPPGRSDSRVLWLTLGPGGSIWGVQRGHGLLAIADANGDPPRSAEIAYADTLAFGVTFAPGHPAVVTSMSGRVVRVWLPSTMGAPRPAVGASTTGVSESPFTRAEGMSGDRIMAALYDREGTLWIGTPTGVDRFRETKLTPLVWPGRVSWPGVAADSNGAVWVAARNGAPSTLFAVGERVVPRRGAPSTLTSIYRDLNAGIWLGGESGLWAQKGAALVRVPLPAPPAAPNLTTWQVHAIAREREGSLWVSMVTDGVYRRKPAGTWERFGLAHGLGKAVANAITTDSSGRTWLGYPDGRVALVVGDSVRVWSEVDGPGVGSVLAIAVHGDRVWIAGQLGVGALRAREARGDVGEPFMPLSTVGEPLRGVSGVVEVAGGDLWLNGADGVTRIAGSEVQRALTEAGYRAQYQRLDYRDGIEPPAPQIRPLPSAVAGEDGRLWFTSAGGVSWVDPRRVRRNEVPPPVHLGSLVASGRRYHVGHAAVDTVRLAPRTTPLTLTYTAYSLAVPERVRFRYRLDGLDTTWQDAGSRREASYTNLSPGHYRFRVMAANDDGVWSTSAASLAFTIDHAWDQTWWFFTLVILAIAGTAAGAAVAWQRRRGQLAVERTQARFSAMLDERTRVARELHDTLLGDMAGVAMQLRVGARRVEASGTADPEVVELLSGLGEQVRHALIEAKRSVTAMRTAPEQLAPLHQQLADAARRTFAGTEVVVQVEHAGAPGSLAPNVESEIISIAAEAMTNARTHADCRKVSVTLSYAPRELRLCVRDDGRGFDLADAVPTGHWGLIGMRERASSIGATVAITSTPGEGTEVAILLPSSRQA
ncbi:MAG: ATP-binding protein [Cytophagaceae bacterium]|nr:ATP-binding protein [Gemmatimonadaceae bacterium]